MSKSAWSSSLKNGPRVASFSLRRIHGDRPVARAIEEPDVLGIVGRMHVGQMRPRPRASRRRGRRTSAGPTTCPGSDRPARCRRTCARFSWKTLSARRSSRRIDGRRVETSSTSSRRSNSAGWARRYSQSKRASMHVAAAVDPHLPFLGRRRRRERHLASAEHDDAGDAGVGFGDERHAARDAKLEILRAERQVGDGVLLLGVERETVQASDRRQDVEAGDPPLCSVAPESQEPGADAPVPARLGEHVGIDVVALPVGHICVSARARSWTTARVTPGCSHRSTNSGLVLTPAPGRAGRRMPARRRPAGPARVDEGLAEIASSGAVVVCPVARDGQRQRKRERKEKRRHIVLDHGRPQMSPSSRPTLANASSANCRSSRVWVAVTMVRTRALSRATVGKPMPWAKTPSAKRRSESRIAVAASPTMTGVIGLSLAPVLNPSAWSPSLKNAVLLQSAVDELGFLQQHVQRRQARGGDRGRMRGRKEERAAAVLEKVDQVPVARDIAAQGADRLRQRADLDIHAAVQPEVIDRSASVVPEHPARVRIVHHHDEPCSSARSHRSGSAPRSPSMLKTPSVISSLRGRARQLSDDAARGVDIAMGKDFDRGPAQPGAVDDAGVVQLIGNDEVVFRQNGGDGSGICRKAALKHDRRFRLLELGEPPLELHVDLHRAGDRAHRAGADAELLQRRERSLLQPGMGRQPEVVVRREVDDLAAVDCSSAPPAASSRTRRWR